MAVRRYLARKIFHLGKMYTLSVLEINSAPEYFKIYPFDREIHSTAFFDGTIFVLAPEAAGIDGLTPEIISGRNLWYKNSGSGSPEPPYFYFVK